MPSRQEEEGGDVELEMEMKMEMSVEQWIQDDPNDARRACRIGHEHGRSFGPRLRVRPWHLQIRASTGAPLSLPILLLLPPRLPSRLLRRKGWDMLELSFKSCTTAASLAALLFYLLTCCSGCCMTQRYINYISTFVTCCNA